MEVNYQAELGSFNVNSNVKQKVKVSNDANYEVCVDRDHRVKTDCQDTQDREEKPYVIFLNTNQNVVFILTEGTVLIYTRMSRQLSHHIHSCVE